jgi:hypothetical protein
MGSEVDGIPPPLGPGKPKSTWMLTATLGFGLTPTGWLKEQPQEKKWLQIQ